MTAGLLARITRLERTRDARPLEEMSDEELDAEIRRLTAALGLSPTHLPTTGTEAAPQQAHARFTGRDL